MIEVRALHKRYAAVVAVDGVSFRAEDGRITGLLGPNGAGKTTTLRMVAGLVRPDSGVACIDGVDVAREPERAKACLGVLPDARGLYARLTARENVRYFGELQGLGGAALERRIDALFERLELAPLAARRVAGFSQGERTKVAIARALVHAPGNVVLDEPTNGLDVMSTRAMRALIRGLREEGRCVVFSSHVMQEVSALCDDVVVVAAGRVVGQGSPDALRDAAGTRSLEDAFVALVGGET
ncbi:MAG: ATP-binding cassette domain-containing protein [Polyangiaceae bacterium]|nr:ATP-binding cassette domain-containing protein [Polyangiaceae bacterium]